MYMDRCPKGDVEDTWQICSYTQMNSSSTKYYDSPFAQRIETVLPLLCDRVRGKTLSTHKARERGKLLINKRGAAFTLSISFRPKLQKPMASNSSRFK